MVKEGSVFVIIPSIYNILKGDMRKCEEKLKHFQIEIYAHSCPQ